MKILEYLPTISYLYGGAERIVEEEIEILSKRHDMSVITTGAVEYTDIFRKLIEIGIDINFVSERPKILPVNGDGWDAESVAFGRNAIIDTSKYDVIATHYTTDSLMIRNPEKNVLHLHGIAPRSKLIDKMSLGRARKLIAVSDYVNNAWDALHPDLHLKMEVVKNGINLKRFRNYHINRDIDFLYIGRLEKHKSVDTLINASRVLEGKLGDKNIVIAGSGSESGYLNHLAKERSKNVKLTGRVKDDDLVELYNRAKFFVYPPYAGEGFSMAVMEAMACGCIPIVSRCCGMPEQVNESIGYLFTPKDEKDLALKMISAIDGKDTLDTKLRESKIRTFDINSVVSKLEKIYLAV